VKSRLLFLILAALLFILACQSSAAIPEITTTTPTISPEPSPTSWDTTPLVSTATYTIVEVTPTESLPTPQDMPTLDVEQAGFPPEFPLMSDAARLVITLGRMEYHTANGLEAVDQFYRDKLVADGWVLSYRGSLPLGNCTAGQCDQGTSQITAPLLRSATSLGQMWTRLGSNLQVLAVVDLDGTSVTINLFSS
jgi:hypothetical protein